MAGPALRIALDVALAHLTSRKRQTLVSLTGVVLGVAFFLAVSSLMRGSELDFLARLVDNSPHVTVYDEFRRAPDQPAHLRWPGAAVEVRHVKPQRETRGIRGWSERLEAIEALPDVRAAATLSGSALLGFAGRQQAVALNGVVPATLRDVSTIDEKMVQGTLQSLEAHPNGVIIGQGLLDKFSLHLGSTLTVLASDGSSRALRVVGVFRTGNASYDEGQAFVLLKRAQALLGRENRVNRIIIQLSDPYEARTVAQTVEGMTGYKSVSWIEASEDFLSLLLVRNLIMYSVVAAILVVASFGIYNTISTIVMEKTRDIAIMKSMGFHASDVRNIFLLEGLLVGLIGSAGGVLLGLVLMRGLAEVVIKPPGVQEVVHLPLWWGGDQFVLAAVFALVSCVLASWLPARRAAGVMPVDILRGAA
ncbi:lipoprotein-releasing system permease protein [Sphaerotilus hippei]|uniref:Lipoprotein-releasing system permease protein n=1 Tax=Sphaerotilus hippei TaxID=744406 RepID=A0A318H915_9BURK|nr:ABC transporter permease [Sphaerotilus hippei]PXW96567.1 lipoprotein-releasing system permease protein [Sphaerotilus hippei]